MRGCHAGHNRDGHVWKTTAHLEVEMDKGAVEERVALRHPGHGFALMQLPGHDLCRSGIRVLVRTPLLRHAQGHLATFRRGNSESSEDTAREAGPRTRFKRVKN